VFLRLIATTSNEEGEERVVVYGAKDTTSERRAR